MTKTHQNQQPGKEMTKEAKEEEQHFKKIINAFKSYKRDSDARLTRSSSNLKRMPLNTQKIINKNGFKANLEILQCCIDLNYGVLKDMIAEPDKMFDNSDSRYNGGNNFYQSALFYWDLIFSNLLSCNKRYYKLHCHFLRSRS